MIPGLPYDERGFLGVAFDPDFKHNGLLYTFTSEDPTAPADFTTQPGVTPGGGQAVVTEWMVKNPHAKQIIVDPASRRVLMRMDKPQFNHNGGDLAFGPTRCSTSRSGDGGNADDEGPGHVPGGNAQSLAAGNVLGKVLRIDPHGSDSANGHTAYPRTTRSSAGRAPTRSGPTASATPTGSPSTASPGGCWSADVGQNDIEEVDVVKAGGNYGWPVKEGTFLFDTGRTRQRPRLGDRELARLARRA